MTATSIESAVVIGGGSGVWRSTVLALATAGARVRAVGRHAAPLEGVRQESAGPGAVDVSVLDATDGPEMDRLIREVDPDLVVVSAGARARLGLVHEQTWDSFSEPWNTDVKMSFQIGQSALRKPLRPGSRTSVRQNRPCPASRYTQAAAATMQAATRITIPAASHTSPGASAEGRRMRAGPWTTGQARRPVDNRPGARARG